jgi:hypothetical protein
MLSRALQAAAIAFAFCGCAQIAGVDEWAAAPADECGSDPCNGSCVQQATFGETDTTRFDGVTTDTLLSEGNPTVNWGAAPHFFAARPGGPSMLDVALLRFDLSAVAGATVCSAALTLTMEEDSSVGTFSVRRVLENWEEGAQDGADGVANWVVRHSSEPWRSAGCQGEQSCDPAPLASLQSADPVQTPMTIALDKAVVDAWSHDPDTNFGMLIVADTDDSASWHSSESTELAKRPVLAISYVP